MQAAPTLVPDDSWAWQAALERALTAHGGPDAWARYTHIAFAFPSLSPHPYAHEHPLIDYRELKVWANSRGWRVRPAPERTAAGQRHSPPVRFTRRSNHCH